ncbi:Hypothetical protein EHI5A_033690 [Entamoeba histolytica KU27]|uniref:BEACH domain-containing protein n=1 Tax=Entamoeba histolytica KU27 TaxID=885311 RepID=M2RUL8_ENTHI|nr:Hypothetical protein EHI5A_033690 [Entamoeba histolytica KU27]
MEDKSILKQYIPILTGIPYDENIALDSIIYSLRDDIASLFTLKYISVTFFSTLKHLLTLNNMMKFDYLAIRNLIITLRQIKPLDTEGLAANPLFVSGVDILTSIIKYYTSQQVIQDLINFYNEIPPIHSSSLLDCLITKNNNSSEVYYSLNGVASFISTVIKIDSIPQECYTIYTQIRFHDIHPLATPCLFSFNANNYYFSLSIDGTTHFLELEINVVTSSDVSSVTPSITHIRNTYKTELKVLPDKWNEISLVHSHDSNSMKVILNGESSSNFGVPYFSSKQKQAIISIGGLDSKTYSYFNGDISSLAWYFNQLTPNGVPSLLLSPKHYASIPSHSFIKPLKSMKNRVVSKEIKIIEYTICTPTNILVVVTRSLSDVFSTYGGISVFLPLLRSGSNTKVTTNIGKILQLFLHCKVIDKQVAITLIVETTKIAQNYLVSTSIIDDFISLCLSLISRGNSAITLIPLLLDIRLWRGIEYLFEYYIKQIILRCSSIDKGLVKRALTPEIILSILTDKICSSNENWKWKYLTHLSSYLTPTALGTVFCMLQNPHLSVSAIENSVGIIFYLLKRYGNLSSTLNEYIDVFITLAQTSKTTSLLVCKMLSLLQPTSDQLNQICNVLKKYTFDYEVYSSLMQCVSTLVTVPFNSFSSAQIETIQNPYFLYILFTLLTTTHCIENKIIDDLILFSSEVLHSIPSNLVIELLKLIKSQFSGFTSIDTNNIKYNSTCKLMKFLTNVIIARGYDTLHLVISFFISQVINLNDLYIISYSFLNSIINKINDVSAVCYIELIAFMSFVNYQKEIPIVLMNEYIKAIPYNYFVTMNTLRSKKEYESLFYLQSYIFIQCLDEFTLSMILQLYPSYIPLSFCELIIQATKLNPKLLQISLNNFSSVTTSVEYQRLIEQSKSPSNSVTNSSLKQFINSIILKYKENHKLIVTEPMSIPLVNCSTSSLPIEGHYNDITTIDKIKQNEISKCYRKTMRSAALCNPFFQLSSTVFIGFITKFLYPTNPIFLTKRVTEPPIKLLSYENLYIPDKSQFGNIPYQGVDAIDCVIKKTSNSSCCKMTFNNELKEIKLWQLNTYHVIQVDDIREIFPRVNNGALCAIELIQRRGCPYFISFENERTYSIAMQKLSLFLEKFKSNVTIITPNKVNGFYLKLWVDGLLSTYEYISVLNCYSTRSLESVDMYYVFPSVEDSKITSNANESLIEHSANTCCLLYTHMPFTRILPLFQLRVEQPPTTVRDIRLITCNCVPQVYASQKIYSGMGGSEDGICYGNKPTLTKSSNLRSIQLAQSPKFGSSALEVVYKKRKELESLDIQKKLGEWLNINFGKKSLTPITNIILKRKKCIDFSYNKKSKETKISVIKENQYLTSSVIGMNIQRNLIIQTETNDIITGEGKDIRTKVVNNKSECKRIICCDKFKNRVIASYQLNADVITLTWKDHINTIKIESIISSCYLMETEYITDLEMFIITKAGSIIIYRIFLDDRNNELKVNLAFTICIGEKIKHFSACTSFGYMVCSCSSTIASYSLHDGSPIYIVPTSSKLFCCSAQGQVYGISGNVITCHDRYGEMYNIFELNHLKTNKPLKIGCLTCGYEDIIFIATNYEVIALINRITSFDVLETIQVNQYYANYSIIDLLVQPTIGTAFNPSTWNVYLQLINNETMVSTYCTLHVDCFKIVTLK